MSVSELIDKELESRQELKEHILQIILDRCDKGHGRVQRGALNLYVYQKLGLIGHPGNYFSKFVKKVLTEAGYRESYLVGKRCYYGLSWKGEAKENWDNPQAADIPVWLDNYAKFEFKNEMRAV